MLSKSLEAALSAMTLLAEVSATRGPETTLTADEIAEQRQLNRPFVAKLLTSLVTSGLVSSKPGRNGGFCLARAPGEIALGAIADSVGYRSKISCCPFGPEFGKDGRRGHCAMHDKVCELRDLLAVFLSGNTLAEFAERARATATGAEPTEPGDA